MQVKVDRRFKNDFLVTNSYTLGKGESYDGGDSQRRHQHADRHRAELGPHGQRPQAHVRQQLRLRPAVPEGRRLGWHRQRLADLGARSPRSRASPLDITMDGALLRAPGNTQRPNMIGDAGDPRRRRRRPDRGSTRRCSRLPAPNTFGNLTRNGAGINAPGYVNLDASLVKKFDFGRRFAEFRVDAFNVTNSLHPNNPNGDLRRRRRSGRSRAPSIRGWCGSASASCSRGSNHPGMRGIPG